MSFFAGVHPHVEVLDDEGAKKEKTPSPSHSDHASERMQTVDKDSHPIICIVIYCFLQAISLILMVVATPLEMFILNSYWTGRLYPALAGSPRSICVTAWGMKHGCRSNHYYNRDYTHTFCYRVRVNFKIVEAFCIMCIFFMLVGLILGCLAVLDHVSRGAVAAVAGTAMFFAIVPWGVIAGQFNQLPCCRGMYLDGVRQSVTCASQNPNVLETLPPFHRMGRYATGFALLVISWIFQVFAIITILIPL